VVTTSASRAAMNEATEVRASTAAFDDPALASVMIHSSLRSKGVGGGTRIAGDLRHWGRMETAKGFKDDFFSFARILWPSSGVFSKAGVVGIGDVLRRGRRHVCVARMTGPQPREHADEEDPRALQDATGPGGGERALDRAGVSRARAKGAAG